MTSGPHSTTITLILSLVACWSAAFDCNAQSAAGQPPPVLEPAAASLKASGCELTQPPSRIIKACAAVLAAEPKNADALARRGNAYQKMGDNAAAFRDFNEAIAIDPNHSFALSRRISLQMTSGNQSGTQADINRIFAIARSKQAKDLEARGFVQSLRQAYAAALNDYSAGLELEPANPLLLVNRAAAYMEMPNLPAAMADYEKLTQTHPDFAFGHLVRGQALIVQKQFDQAIAAIETAIRLDPELPETYVERGRAYLGKKSYDLALADFDKAVEMNPALVSAHYNRGLLHLDRRDYDKAIADLTIAIALNRAFAPAHAARGQAFAQKQDHDRAVADYSKVIELDPRKAEVWLRRSISLTAKGEFDRALADVEEAINLAPTMANAYTERAKARLRSNDFVQAVEDASKAIELQPSRVELQHSLVPAYITRAYAHSKLGQFDRSLADYNKVIAFWPKFAEMYLRRAEVFDALGRSGSASADRARAESLKAEVASDNKTTTTQARSTATPEPQPVATAQPAPARLERIPGVSYSGDTVPRPPSVAPMSTMMLKVAESQISRGEFDLAINELDKIVVLQPGAWPYALRGLAYGGKKDYARALADVSKAIELDGSAPTGFAVRCNIQLEKKAYDKALADCNKAIELGLVNATSYALRGTAHLALKAFNLAIADFDKAIAMGASGSQVTFNRGLSHLNSKNYSQSTDDFRKVIETDPGHRGAILALTLLTQPARSNTPMQVSVVRNADPKCGDQCAEWISAQGQIDGSTPERFRAVLKSIGNRRLPIFIDSLGGSLAASYEVGRIIRARKLDVYVTRTESARCTSTPEVCRKAEALHLKFGLPRGKLASCASACTNILAAGTVRSVGPTALVGVHQAAYHVIGRDVLGAASDRRVPEATYVTMKDYFVEMGVDANLMLRLLATQHKDMYWLTYDELQLSRLTNQPKSGEELVTGGESDEWMTASPRAAENLAKLAREMQKRR
jgi:tetratricopeptide (TPR) repeat protein